MRFQNPESPGVVPQAGANEHPAFDMDDPRVSQPFTTTVVAYILSTFVGSKERMSNRRSAAGGYNLWQTFHKSLSVVRIAADRAVEYIAVIHTIEDHGPSAISLLDS